MQPRKLLCGIGSAAALAFEPLGAAAQLTPDAPVAGRPAAIINLATVEGVRLVKGQWRYSDTKIIEVDHHSPGPDLRPSGLPNKTYDYLPHAGTADFDDSQWEVLDASQLEARKSTGRLCFNWYRIKVTIPEKVGTFDPTGATVVFETV